MDSLIQDIRYALRGLAKSPGFTAAAVLTLALGIGANTAVFSVVDGVLLRPVPFEEADRLVMVWETDRNSGTTREPASVPDFLDFERRSTRLQTLAAIRPGELNLTGEGGEPMRVAALAASHDLLPMLGVRPVAGRLFTPDEDRPGGGRVALIGEGLWERGFGRDAGIIGRTIRLDGVAHSVVGVLPEAADFGVLQLLGAADYQQSFAARGGRADVDLWLPLRPDPEASPRATHPIFMLGRLAPGATPAAAQQELAAIAAELEAAYPVNQGRGVSVEPLTDVVFGPVRPALAVLMGTVVLVLLIACVNVANLLLARGAARAREVAVRAALGAGTGRLARQFLVEGVVLALIGGAAGVLLAAWGTELLLALAPPDVPRLHAVGLDARVLAATFAASILVGLAFGAVPTLQARGHDLQRALRGGRTHGPGGLSASRAALVVAELALAVMLVVGAGLLVRSFLRLQQVDPGFRARGVLKAEFQLPAGRYPVDFSRWPDFAEMHGFNAALLRRVEALPGVEAAAIAGNHPLDVGFTNSFVIVGREAEAADWPEISIRRVTPGYFPTVGLPPVRGRLLRDSDDTFATPVVVINRAAARRFFPEGDPIGRRIAFWGAERTIVGVVADERFHGIAKPAPIAVYAPLAQAPSANGAEALLVRTAGDPAALAGLVRSAIREIDPALAVFGVEPLEETLARSVGQRRFTMLLLGLFAAIAVLLAVVGVHGLLAYTVAQRTPEMGIRLALGASHGSIVRTVLGSALRLTAAGLGLGLLGALAGGRLLGGLLFGVSSADPVTLALVPALVGAVALLASLIPARRATRTDVVVALRVD